MTAKLLEFDIKSFLEKEEDRYNQEAKKELKGRNNSIIKLILLSVLLIVLIIADCYSLKNQILLMALLVSILLVLLTLVIIPIQVRSLIEWIESYDEYKNLSFNDYMKYEREYNFNFIQLLSENENRKLLSAELHKCIYGSYYNLYFTYSNSGQFKENHSYIKIATSLRTDIDEPWYDLSCNKLYVPYNNDLIKDKVCIEVDTCFTENSELRKKLEKAQES